MTETIGALWRSVSSISRPNPATTSMATLSSESALKLACSFNAAGFQGIDLPRIVVVGMQSSGKSSLLNAIMGLDLMPTGGEMVTRVPLDIQLERNESKDEATASFGQTAKDGSWHVQETIPFDVPLMSMEQVCHIRNTIESETIRIAGEDKRISSTPIHLRLRAPHLPNISLVDLPGLTMVACTDKGQPCDIKEQLRTLVREWASPERTIIACVMPARTDLEADVALDLVKEIDPTGIRTVGVITKPDLMSTHDGDLTKYLRGDVSRDLQLGLGYYCVRGRSTEATLAEAETTATAYFNTATYRGVAHRCGTSVLTKGLAHALSEYVRSHLPAVIDELHTMKTSIEESRTRLGIPPPSQDGERLRVLQQSFLSMISKSCSDVDRGKTGLELRSLFHHFRHNLSKICLVNVDDHTLKQLLLGIHGNHLSNDNGCPVRALESLFLGNPRLFHQYRSLAITLATECRQLLRESFDAECDGNGWSERFPSLVKHLHTNIEERIIQDISSDLDSLIERESSYLWTEDAEFRRTLDKAHKDQIEHVRSLINAYTQFLATIFGNAVPKIVMVSVVRPYLNEAMLILSPDKDDLWLEHFCESSSIGEERASLDAKHRMITTMLESCTDIYM